MSNMVFYPEGMLTKELNAYEVCLLLKCAATDMFVCISCFIQN